MSRRIAAAIALASAAALGCSGSDSETLRLDVHATSSAYTVTNRDARVAYYISCSAQPYFLVEARRPDGSNEFVIAN